MNHSPIDPDENDGTAWAVKYTLFLCAAFVLSLAFIHLLGGCTHLPPPPIVPQPGAGCVEACANLERRNCVEAKPTADGESCVDLCERTHANGLGMNTECVAAVTSCSQVDDASSGGC